MEKNWYFRKLEDAVTGSANYSSLISATPTLYGLVSSQSAAFAVLNTALQSAYLAAKEPSTRTPVAIANRNIALKAVQNSAKLLSKIIYATASVNDAQLIALGLLPRTVRQPKPTPTIAPVVEVARVSGRYVTLRIHQADGEESTKPDGAIAANIYTFVGPVAPTDVTEYFYQGMSTRKITEILFPNTVASGATVWISACWVGSRGEFGLSSTPIKFTMQGGDIGALAA